MSKVGEDWAERLESHPPGPEQGDEIHPGDPASPSGSQGFAPEPQEASPPSVSIPIAGWATDETIEPLAMAICYGGFHHPERYASSPAEYWERVSEGPRSEYRAAARMLLAIAQGGCRIMPREPSGAMLEAYMDKARLLDAPRAAKHWLSIYTSIPSLWCMGAQGIEARRAETPPAAPSSDESPVGNADAPAPGDAASRGEG